MSKPSITTWSASISTVLVPPWIRGRIPATGRPTSRIGCAAVPDFVQRTAEYVALPSTSIDVARAGGRHRLADLRQVRVGPTWYVAARSRRVADHQRHTRRHERQRQYFGHRPP